MFKLLKSITYTVRYITDFKKRKVKKKKRNPSSVYVLDASLRCETSSWAAGV